MKYHKPKNHDINIYFLTISNLPNPKNIYMSKDLSDEFTDSFAFIILLIEHKNDTKKRNCLKLSY